VALQLGQFDAAQADLQQALRLLEEAPQADVAPVQEELERIRVAAPGGR
jgi:Tfp pilus assembly protein PilF